MHLAEQLSLAKRQRKVLAQAKTDAPYFVGAKPNLQFVPTGCALLDCALGGGWALGRVANIVGDRSTAKTGLATEAMINFLRTYPDGTAAYRESEAAFDRSYAAAMGLPINEISFGDEEKPLQTIEDFYHDLNKFLDDRVKAKKPGIYVLDSLDALSDEAEMKREFGEATYGANKAKALSEFFRKSARKIEQAQVLLMIVSQVRDNIGAMFGDKHKRSGGRALDFYASQVLWLAHIKTLDKTIAKVKRPYGITVRAKVKKNKVGLPFRECDFDFLFGYGIDDVGASLDWLTKVGRMSDSEAGERLDKIEITEGSDRLALEYNLRLLVGAAWQEIETTFLPRRAKYG